jgi:hypothetical protein
MSVTVAVHLPTFLPWPGFFRKAASADRFVLLDAVQFPSGRTWLTRNRLKNEDGEVWLTVPVLRSGRGLQSIGRVEVDEVRSWRRKHLGTIRQNYVNAPWFEDVFPAVEAVYEMKHSRLIDHNLALIRAMLEALSIEAEPVLQSELGVGGRGTALLAGICRALGAVKYLTLPSAAAYVDPSVMEESGIEVSVLDFRPPVYPQLWGDFVYNLSMLDMLMICGPKSMEIIKIR